MNSGAGTLGPMTMLPALPPHTYMGMARIFLKGAADLSSLGTSNALPVSFLVAQATECALKAYLSREGDDTRLKNDPNLRHNLEALWSLACSEGMPVAAAPPRWLSMLSGLHNKPYYLRYSTGIHGMQTPEENSMVAGVASLVESVAAKL